MAAPITRRRSVRLCCHPHSLESQSRPSLTITRIVPCRQGSRWARKFAGKCTRLPCSRLTCKKRSIAAKTIWLRSADPHLSANSPISASRASPCGAHSESSA